MPRHPPSVGEENGTCGCLNVQCRFPRHISGITPWGSVHLSGVSRMQTLPLKKKERNGGQQVHSSFRLLNALVSLPNYSLLQFLTILLTSMKFWDVGHFGSERVVRRFLQVPGRGPARTGGRSSGRRDIGIRARVGSVRKCPGWFGMETDSQRGRK